MTNPDRMLRNGAGTAFEQTQQKYPYAATMRAIEEQQYPYAASMSAFEQQYPYAGSLPSPDEQRPPLRVVHVGPCFVRGGAEQQTIDLARFLNPNRVKIEKCIVSSPELFDPRVAADMPAPVEIADAEGVRRAAKQCDVMLCWGLDMDSLLNGCRPGLCVFVAHGESDWTRKFLEGRNRAVDHVVAVSHRVQKKVCNGSESSVILNGIDTTRLGRTQSRQDARKSLGFTDEDFVLGYVGRFSPEKRPELVIEAAARLPAHFKVLLVGWGPMRGQLMDMANAMIPGRFAFARMDQHLGDYYQVLDTLCLLSESEGFAMVILEAMMCERPVIATPVGCVPEVVIDRVNGIIVERNVASVCKAAQLLHRHPNWARAIAREGKTFVDQHGHARRMAYEYENLFERLWAQKHGSLAV